jgi:hypothetical protein
MTEFVARTYRLQTETVAQLDALAEALNVYQSDLAELLLSTALADVRAGRLVVRTRPAKYVLDGISRR